MRLISATVPMYSGGPLTPEQIARGLVCVPRWNGGTIAPWSVLHHSVICAMVAQKQGAGPVEILYAILHDVEEIFTGDTPRPYKTQDQAALGDKIRDQILAGLHLDPASFSSAWPTVKLIDDLVGNAERHIFVHPRLRADIPAPDLDVCDMIWEIMAMSRDNPWSLVNAFVRVVENCLASKGGVV